MRAEEKPRPSRNLGKSISTKRTRSSAGNRRRTSSPASIRTELAFDWPRNASRLTAGSSACASSRKRSGLSPIDRLLERLHPDPAVSIEETLARRADFPIALDRALDRVDHAVLVEAGPGDLGLSRVLRARTAEKQLVVLGALAV